MYAPIFARPGFGQNLTMFLISDLKINGKFEIYTKNYLKGDILRPNKFFFQYTIGLGERFFPLVGPNFLPNGWMPS
jgi:hypothetical protein